MESSSKNLSGIVRELEAAANELGSELKSPNCFVIPPSEEGQEELVITLINPERPVKRKSEGEHIMENLTGFGNATGVAGNQHDLGTSISNNPSQGPYLRIAEQPAYNKLRFRYECEGRSAGALVGENTKDKNRTYPAIQIVGYRGPAVVVVSCVEDKLPYRAHPHNLVGKDGICKKGVCSLDINSEDMTCSFQNLGIQCVKRKDAPESLSQRERIRVDPFKQGFSHKNSAVNLNAVRLCFQAFLKRDDTLTPLAPVVSNIVVDRKVHTDLHIYDQSDDWSSVEGGKKIIILCEKVCKDNIEVHFTQFSDDGQAIWHSKAEFGPSAVHKQYAISFVTPPYFNKDIKAPVKVAMYLFKPCENVASEHVEFQYVPVDYYNFNRPLLTANESPVLRNEANKRPKPQGQQDDLSSGSVLGPRKISTAQLRHGGGAVMVMDQNNEMNKRLIEERLQEAVVAGGQERYKIGGDIYVPANHIQINQCYPNNFQQPNQQGYNESMLYQSPAAPCRPDAAQPPESTPLISLDNMNISDLVDLRLSANIDSNLNINESAGKTAGGAGHPESQHGKSQPSQLQTPDISGTFNLTNDGLPKKNDLNKL